MAPKPPRLEGRHQRSAGTNAIIHADMYTRRTVHWHRWRWQNRLISQPRNRPIESGLNRHKALAHSSAIKCPMQAKWPKIQSLAHPDGTSTIQRIISSGLNPPIGFQYRSLLRWTLCFRPPILIRLRKTHVCTGPFVYFLQKTSRPPIANVQRCVRNEEKRRCQ